MGHLSIVERLSLLKGFPLNYSKFRNPLTTDNSFLTLSDFGWMLSVVAIRFEDMVCTTTKGWTGRGGWVHHSGWQCMVAVAAACRKALLNNGWAVCLLSCTSIENGPFTLKGLHIWHLRHLLVLLLLLIPSMICVGTWVKALLTHSLWVHDPPTGEFSLLRALQPENAPPHFQ